MARAGHFRGITRPWDPRAVASRSPPCVAGPRLPGRIPMKHVVLALAVLVASTVTFAQSHTHVIAKPDEAQWGAAPPMLPPGAQIAVLSGDPSKAAPYAVRLKFPAHYAI